MRGREEVFGSAGIAGLTPGAHQCGKCGEMEEVFGGAGIAGLTPGAHQYGEFEESKASPGRPS
jgi:hypothetical protein